MFTSIRYFTKEEAEALLPQISQIILSIQGEKEKLDQKFRVWELKEKSGDPAQAALLRGQIEFLAKTIEGFIEKVQSLGCVLKDISTGLIDFPARINGKEAYLCWKPGESGILFWHGITEGFPGRKPL